jgi:hypothetical protein
MDELTFAFMPANRGSQMEAVLLARSLRKFGGGYAQAPLWVLVPERAPLSDKAQGELASLNARVLPFEAPPAALEFPYAVKVYAAAAAEAHLKGETSLLAWLDPDTLIFQEPAEFRLPEGIMLGCCPVQLKNVSSVYAEPLDDFWKLVFAGCQTPPGRVFPLTTTVDRVTIRAQINAGLLVVRPLAGLLQIWKENFSRLYADGQFDRFYARNRLYAIFVHQAILAGTVLAQLEQANIRIFPLSYNYALFLHERTPPEFQARALNDLVTCRYDEQAFFLDPHWQTLLPAHEPLKGWLTEQVTALLAW